MKWEQGITGGVMRPRAARSWTAAAIAAAAGLLGGASEKQVGPASPPPAPACQAQDAGSGVAPLAAVIETLRRREAQRAPGARVVEALDNRGYGYGPDPDSLAELPIQEPRPPR